MSYTSAMGNPRSKVFTLRLDIDEWQKLHDLAAAKGKSVGALLRAGVGLPAKRMGRPKLPPARPSKPRPPRR